LVSQELAPHVRGREVWVKLLEGADEAGVFGFDLSDSLVVPEGVTERGEEVDRGARVVNVESVVGEVGVLVVKEEGHERDHLERGVILPLGESRPKWGRVTERNPLLGAPRRV